MRGVCRRVRLTGLGGLRQRGTRGPFPKRRRPGDAFGVIARGHRDDAAGGESDSHDDQSRNQQTGSLGRHERHASSLRG